MGDLPEITAEAELAPRNSPKELSSTERAPAEWDSELGTLTDLSPVALVRTDERGLVTFVNKRFLQIHGREHEADEMLGSGWANSIHPDDLGRLEEEWARCIKSNSEFRGEYRVVQPDGHEVWVLGQTNPVPDQSGKVIGHIGTLTDITDRKLAEQALAERERELTALTDLSPAGLYRSNTLGELTYVSDRWREIMGLEEDAALVNGWTQRMHPDDLGLVSKVWKEFVESKGTSEQYSVECRIICPDGTLINLISQVAPEYNEDGKLIGYVGTITDVTNLKNTQLALEHSEKRFSLAMQGSSDGLYDWDMQTGDVYYSPRWHEMLGYEDGELPPTTKTWEILLHPDDLRRVIDTQDEWIKSDAKSIDIEVRFRHKNGHYVDILSRSILVRDDEGTTIRMVGTNTDISRRKQAEAALLESEERFSLAARAANDGLWDWDYHTGKFYYSPRWFEMIGYEEGELPAVAESWEKLLHPDDRIRIAQFQKHFVKSEAKNLSIEVKVRHKDGHYVDVLSRVTLVRDKDGIITRMVGTNTDISQRKHAEAALLESEEKFRAITENTTDVIVVLDPDGIHKYVSPSAARLAGMKSDEILGTSVRDIIHPDDADKFMRTLHRAWSQPGETAFSPEFRVIYPDGRTIYFEALFTGLPDVLGIEGIVVNARDVTARKMAETDLMIAKEHAEAANRAKSEFLSSMSHELRTPMNAVLGFAQLLEQNDETLAENHKEFVAEILRSGHHMLDLIGDVLDLAKIESGDISLDMTDEDPKPLIDACLNMVAASADQKELVLDAQFPNGDLPTIKVDALRFKQALLNMLSNAVKYNEVNGKVVLECNSGANGILHISVSDTGPGIPGDLHYKVFEPFDRLGAESSSTPGTGIGLTVTKQLIESMGGTVGFESTVGEGTTFWINLPIAKTQAPVAKTQA